MSRAKIMCCFGAGRPPQCQKPAVWACMFKGKTTMHWCQEHGDDLRTGLRTPGHTYRPMKGAKK